MAAYRFQLVGTASVISTGFNNYLNGFVGIQPDQGVLQGEGTNIGARLNIYAAAAPNAQYILDFQGESDQNNTWIRWQLSQYPAANNPFGAGTLPR